MPHPAYEKPPITEAVIDFQFSSKLDGKALKNVQKLMSKRFPDIQENLTFGIEFGPSNLQLSQSPAGFKAISSDTLDIVLVQPNALTNSRLAPYNGWEKFSERTNEVWTSYRKAIGKRKIKRVGMRYINRLDIPGGGVVTPADWLQLGVILPKNLSPDLNDFSVRLSGQTDRENVKYILSCQTAQSPLINFVAFVLDIDVYVDVDIPQTEKELWKLLQDMRGVKNSIFESCITDKMRSVLIPIV